MTNTLLPHLLVILLLLQTLVILALWRRKKRLQRRLEKTGNVARTRKQLYREIERHQETEITLQETQTYLQALIDSMPAILIGVSPDGTVTHWNKSAERVTGLMLKDVFGKALQDVFPSLPIDMAMIEQTLSSGEPQYKKNIKQGEGVDTRYTDIVVYPLLISEEVEEAVVMATDVSMRVQIENRIMQSDKMQSLGEMAAGLAHEINNPLAGILHHVQNIKRRTSPDLATNRECAENLGLKIEDVYQYLFERNILSFLDNIQIAGERSSQIVNNMLNFARTSPATFVETDMQELIAHSVELAINSFSQNAHTRPDFPEIIQEIEGELPKLECAPIEVQQVIINLLRNAVQAFDSDEVPSNDLPSSKARQIHIRATHDQYAVVLKIQDNGPGIPADIRNQIFEPFFTTKKVGQGTGLGLSVCYFIVKDHHEGEISVESEPGTGTCFTVTLPLSHTFRSGTSRALPLPPQLEPTEYPRQI